LDENFTQGRQARQGFVFLLCVFAPLRETDFYFQGSFVMTNLESYRRFLKADVWEEWDHAQSDQNNKVAAPPLQKPYPADAPLIDLIPPADFTVGDMPLREAIARRQSRRQFGDAPLTLEDLSFLLWAAQGVQEIWRGGIASRRTVPSAGSRHPFETYLLVNHVESLTPGVYRYLALEHKLLFLRPLPPLEAAVEAFSGQKFVAQCAVTFIWTVIPYRTEWRYGMVAHKVIAMDIGHACQNLYLACESIGAGTCAIGAYHQKKLDALLELDGVEEFAIYVAPVGKLSRYPPRQKAPIAG